MKKGDGENQRPHVEPFVYVVQHEQCEGLGTIAESLAAAGVATRYVRSFAGDSIPAALDGASGLVVMGGPMGVYDHPRLPFLKDEMRLIESTLRLGRPVLGICLGSQLLAQVLGAEVRPSGHKEIGWLEVRLTEAAGADPLWTGVPQSFMAFHWHGDAFSLPPGATHLASTRLIPCQAYRFGTTAYGIQFHLEVTEGIVREMLRTWPDELQEEGLDGREIIDAATRFLPAMRAIGRGVFGRWVGLLADSVLAPFPADGLPPR
ncbi:MAG: gamma-glutamyl-gamma-aminobutyrate hydrolase family protein [Gemmatimonadetes bacterium]|nr:gamma-glutamyl-gamma-aminobutyrate hydrolase family protein [Gemmatimonadota bacterium]